MSVLKEIDKKIKCSMCDNTAEYECAVCKRKVCDYHIRFGRLYGYNHSKFNEYYCIPCWRIERNNLLKHKVSKIEIFNKFKKLGIKQGDCLLVQSSISSFGNIENGAETLIDILMLMIGKRKGTLIMPTFTPHSIKFHPRSSITDPVCGKLCELFRKRAKTTRTDNSKISFTAYGKHAIYIINNAIKYDKLDELSPMKRIMNKNSKLLMLGTEFNNCLPIKFAETVIMKNKVSCGKRYIQIEPDIKKLSSYKEIVIGHSLCRIIDIKQIYELVSEKLMKNHSYFTCNVKGCPQCSSQNKVSKYLFDKHRISIDKL
jgi:aminoglycoside N3'-acetyltransferase